MAASHVLVVVVALAQLTYNEAASPASTQGADTKLADTLRALDTNGDGKVDQAELMGFAKAQGLSSEEVLTDFKELDANHDGALDLSEIGPLLGATDAQVELAAAPASTAAAQDMNVAAKAAPQIQNTQVAAKAAPQAKSTTGLDLAALQRDAQEQAGAVMASRLAQRAQVLLARSAADEHKAEAFDTEVRTLRGNATTLAKKANGETRKAARVASHSVSDKSLGKLKQLREQERHSEADAADKRGEAKKAMERVRKAQASLRSA